MDLDHLQRDPQLTDIMMVEGTEGQVASTKQAPDTEHLRTSSDGDKPNEKHYHHRKRKRHLFNAIRQQMEFYFSDANLAKDRYLKKLIEQDPFVPLSVFMTFNRIKKLASSTEQIEKALDCSETLELSCDRLRVRRTTDISIKPNADEFTIYVEALPPTATIETVKNIFKQFGPVAYVSLPKYKRSGKIKEFAFVEFEEKQSVDRCLAVFKEHDCVIDVGNSQPEQLASVKSYVKEQEEIEREGEAEAQLKEATAEAEQENRNELSASTAIVGGESASHDEHKRKFSEFSAGTKDASGKIDKENEGNDQLADFSDADSVYSNSSVGSKRRKLNTEPNQNLLKPNDENGSSNENNETTDGERMDENEDDNALNIEEMDDGEGGDDARKASNKRRRRRRRKERLAEHIIPTGNTLLDEKPQTLADLRVTTKTDWKRLRNKYLMFQRQQYAQVKRELIQKQHKQASGRSLPSLPRPVVIKNKQLQQQQAQQQQPQPQPPTQQQQQQFQQPQSNQVTSAKAIRSNARNMNFYGANVDAVEPVDIDENLASEGDNANNSPAQPTQSQGDGGDNIVDSTNNANASKPTHIIKKPLFEFEPGIIVRVNFDIPCVNVADFKAEMKQYPCVRYVDLREGQTSAYVRVDNPRSAPTIIKQCAPNRCQILTGDSERAYWDKINHDREQKLNKTVRVKGRRGRDRLIAAAGAMPNATGSGKAGGTNSHIRFDE